jgi:hypothetical protein
MPNTIKAFLITGCFTGIRSLFNWTVQAMQPRKVKVIMILKTPRHHYNKFERIPQGKNAGRGRV